MPRLGFCVLGFRILLETGFLLFPIREYKQILLFTLCNMYTFICLCKLTRVFLGLKIRVRMFFDCMIVQVALNLFFFVPCAVNEECILHVSVLIISHLT